MLLMLSIHSIDKKKYSGTTLSLFTVLGSVWRFIHRECGEHRINHRVVIRNRLEPRIEHGSNGTKSNSRIIQRCSFVLIIVYWQQNNKGIKIIFKKNYLPPLPFMTFPPIGRPIDLREVGFIWPGVPIGSCPLASICAYSITVPHKSNTCSDLGFLTVSSTARIVQAASQALE